MTEAEQKAYDSSVAASMRTAAYAYKGPVYKGSVDPYPNARDLTTWGEDMADANRAVKKEMERRRSE